MKPAVFRTLLVTAALLLSGVHRLTRDAIAAAEAGISFAQWLRIGVPAVALLLPLMIAVLYLVLRPRLGGRVASACEPLVWTRGRRVTVLVFALTAAGWVLAAPLARALGIGADIDSVVAIAAVVALLSLGAIDWPQFERCSHWDVLLLFGGGLALGRVMEVSGGSRFLADALVQQLHGAAPLLVLLGVVAFVVFLTELVSNTAVAALLVPVFMVVGDALGLPGPVLAGAIAVAASCAFMLPVATPPNAMVFGSGYVTIPQMCKAGFWLNVIGILLITLLSMLVLGPVLGVRW